MVLFTSPCFWTRINDVDGDGDEGGGVFDGDGRDGDEGGGDDAVEPVVTGVVDDRRLGLGLELWA